MTNQDKADLRYALRYCSEKSNREIANEIGCHIGTVRRWRRVIRPKETLEGEHVVITASEPERKSA